MRNLLSQILKSSILPYLVIFTFGIIIYFYIDGKLLFNPDFGQSDIYHGYGVRYYLSENLKNNKLPFWTDMWLGGFPFFSEWQVGSLFLPNLIFYKFLPFPVAVNVLIIYVFILLASGFYLLMREFGTNKWLALLISLNFVFNGSLAFRLTHVNLLQTFSLCPILYFLILKFIKTNKPIYLLIIPLIVSQMIFDGFIPVIYIVLMGLLFFIPSYLITVLKLKFRKMIPVCSLTGLSLLVAAIISLPQILPSMTLSNLSSRSLNLDFNTITAYPFGIKNMLNFINPFIFGNPKSGTYPIYNNDWGIFWENTPYVGPIAAVLLFISLIYAFLLKSDKRRFLAANLLIIIFFLLLVLGKSSPLYFLFEFPPFNLFRTQSRFLIMVCFFIFITLGISLNNIFLKSKRFVRYSVIILLIINLFDLISVQKNYHLFADAKQVLQKPKFVSSISNVDSYITLGQAGYWNNVFLRSGWKSDTEINKYLFYRNFLHPNANLLYDKKIYDISNGLGFKPRRNEYLQSLLINNFSENQNDPVSIQNSKNLMLLLGIKYVITPREITDSSIKKITDIKLDDETIYLYDFNPSKLSQKDYIYSPSSVKLILTLTDFDTLFQQNNDFSENAVIETTDNHQINNKADFRVIQDNIKEDSIEIKAEINKRGLIVFRKNYYPGWMMKIDGQVTPIEKINLVHMGVFVLEGKHTIRLSYQNTDFYKGLTIAAISYAAYLVFILVIAKLKKIKK